MVRKREIARIVMIIGITVSLLCGVSIGAEQSMNTFSGGNEASIGIELGVSRDTMVLDGKEDDCVLFCKRRYEVTKNTVIKNEWGRLISLYELMVPCNAVVSYYRKPRVKNTYLSLIHI